MDDEFYFYNDFELPVDYDNGEFNYED